MRIAIIADPIDNQNAGIHVYTREMVNALIRTNPGHEIVLIREKYDRLLKNVKQVCIPNIRLPVGFASLRLFFIVPLLIRKHKADIVIEPAHFGPFNLPRCVKRVTIIHDLTPILFPRLHRWHSQMLQKIFLKGILRRAHLIITNSDSTTKDVCRIYPENCSKTRKIYPGRNESFNTDGKRIATEPYFLFAGTIEPRKNLETLLKAFRIYRDNGGKCSLIIAGAYGWKSDRFRKAYENHPYKKMITIVGFVPDDQLKKLYQNATAMIYPSLYEGFGLPVIEAMACGTPVITCNNSSLPEAGGNAALYFEARDESALEALMQKVASEPALRNELSAKSLQHAARFSWDNFGNSLWKELISIRN